VDGLRLAISVERAETADIVRRHLDVLQRTLQADGVTVDRVQVGVGSDPAQGGRAEGDTAQDGAFAETGARSDPHAAPTSDEAADTTEDASPEGPIRASGAGAGRLDIRF
jgi:hypothetical protein